MKNKKYFNYLRFDFKRHHKMNFFTVIQFILLICIFNLIFSNSIMMLNYKKYESKTYENVTRCMFFGADLKKYHLEDKEVLGAIIDSDPINSDVADNTHITLADKFVFDNFKLPLVKGRYPKTQGEALASWKNRNYLNIGEKYTVNINREEVEIVIVGYTQGKIGYGCWPNSLGTFYTCSNSISILWDTLSIAEYSGSSAYLYLNMSQKDIDEYYNKYYFDKDEQEKPWLLNINTAYFWEIEKNSSFEMFLTYLFLIVIILSLIVIFTDDIRNKYNNKLEKAVCYLNGQPKSAMINLTLMKNILFFLISAIISFVITRLLYNSGNNELPMTYKGWVIAVVICLIVMCFIILLNVLSIKKQNICETININV